MAPPLMPKATAVWLVENTTLTFVQIADFCSMHRLEVQAIADDEVAIGMRGLDPVANGQLTLEELERCQADAEARLVLAEPKTPVTSARPRGARYTPVSKRRDRPDAIAWLVKNYPELSDAQISKLIGTTKPTINAVRDKTHWNSSNIKPQSPVALGLCSEDVIGKAIDVARVRAGTADATARTQGEPSDDGAKAPTPTPGPPAEFVAAPPPAEAPPREKAAGGAASAEAPAPTAESVFGSPGPEGAAPAGPDKADEAADGTAEQRPAAVPVAAEPSAGDAGEAADAAPEAVPGDSERP